MISLPKLNTDALFSYFLRARAVGVARVSAFFKKSSTLPEKRISPPSVPPPGPVSTMLSAILIASISCSTAITVFPLSRIFMRRLSTFFSSPRLSPILGSSKTKVVPFRGLDAAEAILILWISLELSSLEFSERVK